MPKEPRIKDYLTNFLKNSFRRPRDDNEAYLQSWTRYINTRKVIDRDSDVIDKAIKYKTDRLEGETFDKADYVAFGDIKSAQGQEFARNRAQLGQDGTPVTRDDVNEMDRITLGELKETLIDRDNRNVARYLRDLRLIAGDFLGLNNPVQATPSNPVQTAANNPVATAADNSPVTTPNSSAAALPNDFVTTASNDSVTATPHNPTGVNPLNPEGQTPTQYLDQLPEDFSPIEDQLDD